MLGLIERQTRGRCAMRDLRQVDLKQVRDEVADRVSRAAKELGSRAGHAARELATSAEESANARLRKPSTRTRRSGPSPLSVISGAVAGAVAVYFLDPQRGRARRA